MFLARYALALCAVGLAGCATSPNSPHTTIAAVQAVYVEVAPDIYVSEQLMTTAPNSDYWVKLTLNGPDPAAGTTMARVPASLRLAAGDQVAVDVAPLAARADDAPQRRASRVVDIVTHGALAQAPAAPAGDVIARYLSDTGSATAIVP